MKQIFKITKKGEETLCFEEESNAIAVRNSLNYNHEIVTLNVNEEGEFSVKAALIERALAKLTTYEVEMLQKYYIEKENRRFIG